MFPAALSSRADAEDVTSEVFEHALTNLRKFEWRGVPFLAWLFRIAANALADRWRRASRDSHELPPDVPDRREAEDIERRAMVAQLVDRLPDAQRRVIEMRFVDRKHPRDRDGARSFGRRRQAAAVAGPGDPAQAPGGPRWLTRSSIGWIRPSTCSGAPRCDLRAD